MTYTCIFRTQRNVRETCAMRICNTKETKYEDH